MEELIGRVTAATGIDAATAGRALGLMLAYLKKEGPQLEVEQMIAAMPGADELLTETMHATSGGQMGISGGGGLMALAGQLNAAGLGMDRIPAVAKELFEFAREKAGEGVVGRIVAGIPGLAPYV